MTHVYIHTQTHTLTHRNTLNVCYALKFRFLGKLTNSEDEGKEMGRQGRREEGGG